MHMLLKAFSMYTDSSLIKILQLVAKVHQSWFAVETKVYVYIHYIQTSTNRLTMYEYTNKLTRNNTAVHT